MISWTGSGLPARGWPRKRSARKSSFFITRVPKAVLTQSIATPPAASEGSAGGEILLQKSTREAAAELMQRWSELDGRKRKWSPTVTPHHDIVSVMVEEDVEPHTINRCYNCHTLRQGVEKEPAMSKKHWNLPVSEMGSRDKLSVGLGACGLESKIMDAKNFFK